MSSVSYASLYRPKTFDEVKGQRLAIEVFKRMIQKDSIPSVILLAGPAGTGKTSLARVLATAAVCTELNLESVEPCLACNNCKAVQNSINYMFLDGAGSQVKEQVENNLTGFLNSNPVGSRYKVCVADEAQALSSGARNALLTLTENLPPRSIFIMTTTDPEDIDIAVRSRCFKLFLKPLSIEDLVKSIPLDNVPKESLSLLASHSDGCLREMWQKVQQLDILGDYSLKSAIEITQTTEVDNVDKLISFVLDGDIPKLQKLWDKLINSGCKERSLGKQLLERVFVKLETSIDPTLIRLTELLAKAEVIAKDSGWFYMLVQAASFAKPDLEKQAFFTAFK